MTRRYFDHALQELRDQILIMGSYVAEELRLAMTALETLDLDAAHQVADLDRMVNEIRFAIEDRCFVLLVTQQPAARDLRLVFSAANMIVDLERMGDQAKGIAKVIPEIKQHPTLARPPELRAMGALVDTLFAAARQAYAEGDTAAADALSRRDDEVDTLFAAIFTHTMVQLAKTDDPEVVQATYHLLRIARELERFGDLVTNFAERTTYLLTGEMPDPRAAGPITGRRT